MSTIVWLGGSCGEFWSNILEMLELVWLGLVWFAGASPSWKCLTYTSVICARSAPLRSQRLSRGHLTMSLIIASRKCILLLRTPSRSKTSKTFPINPERVDIIFSYKTVSNRRLMSNNFKHAPLKMPQNSKNLPWDYQGVQIFQHNLDSWWYKHNSSGWDSAWCLQM